MAARRRTLKDQVLARWNRIGKPEAFILRSKLWGAQRDYAVVYRPRGPGITQAAFLEVYSQEGQRRTSTTV